jgi:hypothetical protein
LTFIQNLRLRSLSYSTKLSISWNNTFDITNEKSNDSKIVQETFDRLGLRHTAFLAWFFIQYSITIHSSDGCPLGLIGPHRAFKTPASWDYFPTTESIVLGDIDFALCGNNNVHILKLGSPRHILLRCGINVSASIPCRPGCLLTTAAASLVAFQPPWLSIG